jgi:GxxExxY protein
LAVGLRRAGAYVEQEVQITVRYLGEIVGDYRADLIIDHDVIVEVKAIPRLARSHRSQLINYLKATRCERGLLLNFGPEPQFERLILTNDQKSLDPLPNH